MSGIVSRLVHDKERGEILDGSRRYLLMRPDVLMGMLQRLDDTARVRALSAFAGSACEQGGDSIRAYAKDATGQDLLDVVSETSAGLGWGRWQFEVEGDRLRLTVRNSPFAWGYGVSSCPVCAPVAGIFRSVATEWLGAPAVAAEVECGAMSSGQDCKFVAYREVP
ncbi:hypothetical protein FAZ95_12065 [Trinickia violacea]|uniref:4-vinyl reductase 4VR domain-containing protein n=1 Tax=Trinickia violacea TaxID=2571746 RepID=A0A4P8IRM4_9BURK|nr:V4R domain-containing protein [Trinickia violacea]QCP49843.1 hypothetical protein FAZ95_12065 [Trinickia violacea]